MKKIRTFLNAWEAEEAKNLLTAEGIPAYVENANTQTALSYIGSAVGGVRLMVAQNDVDRAVALLDRETSQDNAFPWQCPNCQETVDPGFDICWNCGTEHADSAQLAASNENGPSPDSNFGGDAAAFPAPPSSRADSMLPEGVSAEQSETDELAVDLRRATIAAIVGCVFLPGITHLYSIFLLVRHWSQWPGLTTGRLFQVLCILALDVLAIIILLNVFIL